MIDRLPIDSIQENPDNPRRRGKVILCVKEAIELHGSNCPFQLADIVAMLPDDLKPRTRTIGSILWKLARKDILLIATASKGGRQPHGYVWPGEWPHVESPEERFWKNVEKSAGCWLWHGNRDDNGYGRFGIEGQIVLAHRFSWLLATGRLSDDICILHKCDNPPCVCPDHLFEGDRGDNARDMAAKGRQWLQRRKVS